MTHTEQRKLIAELKDYQRKMSRSEQEEFSMFVKRDKDDEDLDEISKNKIQRLYETYIANRPKKSVKSPFGDIVEK
jgi:hypothetical protein